MSLPFRCNRENVIRVCAALLFVAIVVLVTPRAAHAWDDEWHHHHHWRYHDRWGDHWDRSPAFLVPPLPRFFVPAPFGVRIYQGYDPGYYPVPVYRAPCREQYEEEDDDAYYDGPPAYVPVAPPAVNLEFRWVFDR